MVASIQLSRDATPAPAPSARAHVAFLDGLRALAALWVVFSHVWVSQFGMLAHLGLLGLCTNGLLYSHLAVDLFIVLSGFCLILPVCRTGSLPKGPLDFYFRRARRILPPFYAALAFSLLAALLLQACDHRTLGLPPKAVLVNAALMQDLYLDQNIFNGPFWSIAVEWRIYFLFPLVVWSLTRWGSPATLAWTALVGYAMTGAVLHFQPGMYLSCPWYLFLFAMGTGAGWAAFSQSGLSDRDGKPWGWVLAGFAVLLVAALWRFPVTDTTQNPFGSHLPLIDAIAGAAAASLLVVVARGASKASRIAGALLGSRPIAALGAFAYSLYLVHMPCLNMLSRLLASLSAAPAVRAAILAAAGVPVIVALAYLFFYVFERPFLSSRPPSARV